MSQKSDKIEMTVEQRDRIANAMSISGHLPVDTDEAFERFCFEWAARTNRTPQAVEERFGLYKTPSLQRPKFLF